ncbi:NlpC/P60 family protein [uncultured Olegusella sp.]|uniref:C40 family peptidase n=1 Tax=uncultured Olegusella sp. TaxID=1979846 RepID=UPI00262F21A4|nr:NlpC/P60 family protein [uncultured Olegusella sp.]
MDIKHKAVVAGLTVAFALATMSPFAFAAPSAADLNTAQAKLESLGGELASIQSDLDSQAATLQRTQTDIAKKQTQIDSTKEDLKSARKVLGNRMRSNYKTGGFSLLSLLLGSESAEDLISNIYIADRIADQDAANISAVRDLEDQLNKEKSDLESKENDQEAKIKKTQQRADEYSSKVAAAQEYYDSLSAEVKAQLEAEADEEEKQAAETISKGGTVKKQSGTSTAVGAIREYEQQQNISQAQNKSAGKSETKNKTKNNKPRESGTKTPSKKGSGGHAYSGGGLSSAYSAIGLPYVSGAAGPDSFDCSGLVCYCYGYARGRTTYDMIDSLKASGDWHTSLSELNPGDLAFTHSGHVGIYVGNNIFIDAPSPGRTVTQRSMWSFIGGGPY